MTPEQLRQIMGPVCSPERAAACAPSLTDALALAQAFTVTRAAAMLAQVAWESGQLRFLVEPEENANGYDGGARYRGRGFIQLTHLSNYRRAGDAIGVDLVEQPDLAAELEIAARVTAWYWDTHGLNALADARDFEEITRRVNGKTTDGPPSYHDRREKYYKTALEVLGVTALVG